MGQFGFDDAIHRLETRGKMIRGLDGFVNVMCCAEALFNLCDCEVPGGLLLLRRI